MKIQPKKSLQKLPQKIATKILPQKFIYPSDNQKLSLLLQRTILNKQISQDKFIKEIYAHFKKAPVPPPEIMLNSEKHIFGHRTLDRTKPAFQEIVDYELKHIHQVMEYALDDPALAKLGEIIKTNSINLVVQICEKFITGNYLPKITTAFEIEEIIYEFAKIISGNKDPYKNLKEDSNKKALADLLLFDQCVQKERNFIEQLDMAIRIGIAGNLLDFAAPYHVEKHGLAKKTIKSFIENIRQSTFKENQIEMLYEKLTAKPKQTILFFADNAGEIIADLPLLKLLMQELKHKIIIVSRSRPTVNDMYDKDMRELLNHPKIRVYLGKKITVVPGGSSITGSDLRRAPKELVAAWKKADFIIAKGQGNFQTLRYAGLPEKLKGKNLPAYNFLTKDSFYILVAKDSLAVEREFGQEGDIYLKYIRAHPSIG